MEGSDLQLLICMWWIVCASWPERRLVHRFKMPSSSGVSLALLAAILFVSAVGSVCASGYQVRAAPGGFYLSHSTTGASDPSGLKLMALFGEIRIEGGIASVDAELEEQMRALSGKTNTAEALFTLAHSLQATYAKAGYPLIRIFLPAQRLGAGRPVRLQIIDVTIERVETRDVPAGLLARVGAFTRPIVGKRHLTTREVQEALALLQFDTGLTFRQELIPGSTAGLMRLLVLGESRQFTGNIQTLQTFGKPVQRSLLTGTVTLANPLGIGDRWNLAIAASRRSESAGILGPYGAASLAVQLPLASTGLYVEPYVTMAQERRRSKLGPDTDYSLGRAGVRLIYPIVLPGGVFVALRAGGEQFVEDVLSRQSVSGFDVASRQRYSARALRLGFLSSYSITGFSLEASADVALGHGGGLIKNEPSYLFMPVAYRTRTTDAFAKVEANIRAVLDLPADFKLEASLRLQQRFLGSLAPNEQMQLLQTVSITPFNPETAQGDNGYQAKLELSRQWSTRIFDEDIAVKPFAFGSVGSVVRLGTAERVRETTRGFKYGGGISVSRSGLSLTIEAFRIETSDEQRAQSGINLRLSQSF
jgi:hemolysin activation/secretion protein